MDSEFGTGVVKITPAHDFNDYEMGRRHDLPMINIFEPDATLNGDVPEKYQGMDRYAARKQIVADLDELGLLDKVEDHKMAVPRGEKSGVVVEPYLSDQWFVKISPAEPAIAAVENGDIEFIPKQYENNYFAWMRDIQTGAFLASGGGDTEFQPGTTTTTWVATGRGTQPAWARRLD